MVLLLIQGSAAAACPSALFMLELTPRVAGPRNGLRLFVAPYDAKNGAWEQASFDISPVDKDGHIMFFKDASWRGQNIAPTDFLMMRQEDFGRRLAFKEERLPCKGPVVYELRDEAMKRFAYLTNCGTQDGSRSQPNLPVSFDQARHMLESENYRYLFNPANYMQFKSISFKRLDGAWDLAAYDSRLLIKADVKNFFTMSFDSKEVESHLEETRLGPIGNLARLSFFLRILFFKLKMSLSTDVGFFSDSGHIPMMVNIPVDASKFLNPGSGILYSWMLSSKARQGKQDIQMPRLDTGLIKKGYKPLAQAGLKFCKEDVCRFRYTVELLGRQLAMDLTFERRLVEQGFFPVYVDDVARYKKDMGWEIDTKPDQQRMGMYFEVAGLPEGGHPWDFWLRLGARGDSGSTCPVPLRFARIPDSYLK